MITAFTGPWGELFHDYSADSTDFRVYYRHCRDYLLASDLPTTRQSQNATGYEHLQQSLMNPRDGIVL